MFEHGAVGGLTCYRLVGSMQQAMIDHRADNTTIDANAVTNGMLDDIGVEEFKLETVPHIDMYMFTLGIPKTALSM